MTRARVFAPCFFLLTITLVDLGCGATTVTNHAWRDDEFDGANLDDWLQRNPNLAEVSLEGGALVLRPDPLTAWYGASEAFQLYQLISGDFAVTARVTVTDLGGGAPQPDWRLGGLLLRDPAEGPSNTYHAALGTVSAAMNPGPVAEFKSTDDSSSVLGAIGVSAAEGELRVCRAEGLVRSVYRTDASSPWVLVDERSRPDLPLELAVGPMAYAYDSPADLEARFDFIDFDPLSGMSECEAELPEESTSTGGGGGATLPPHEALDILVLSDTVNPNNLPPGALTEGGDLEPALAAATSGLQVASIDTVSSSCVDDALTLLESGAVDVLVHFAHDAAQRCDGSEAETELTAAIESHLQGSGGVVVFHHGTYLIPGREQTLQLLGVSADSFIWEPVAGQTVINVAPGHFVTDNGIEYPSSTSVGSSALGIPLSSYPSFSNVPDERYPGLSMLSEPGETRQVLWASDYAGVQVLGYDLVRPDWTGHVVMYQPGEYEPLALDPDGNNFQVLVNSVYYAGTQLETPSGGTDSDGGESSSSDGGTTGGESSSSDGGTTGGESSSSDDGTTGGESSSSDGGTTGGESSSSDDGTTGGASSSSDDGTTGGASSSSDDGTTGGDESTDEGTTGGSPVCVGSFDGTGDLGELDDEFDDDTALACWQIRHIVDGEPATYSSLDIDDTNPGELTIVPLPGGWFNDYRGVHLYKQITGDFMVEVELSAESLAAVGQAPTLPFSIAGISVRDPASEPGDEDWLELTVGSQWFGAAQTGVKDTTDSVSTLMLDPVTGETAGRLRICRVGDQFIFARLVGNDTAWTSPHQVSRPDLPATVNVGPMATAWGIMANDPSTDAPDLLARWEYARFLPIADPSDCVSTP